MKIKIGFLLLLLVVMVSGLCFLSVLRKHPVLRDAACATAESADDHAGSEAEGDDQARIRTLEQTAEEMIRRRRITPMATLIEQLDRQECKLALPIPSDRRMMPGEIYSQYKPSVLVVAGIYKCPKCGRWHANAVGGFFITETGACVTNYHVVDKKSEYTLLAMTDEGRVFPVREVLAASKAHDAAILQLETAEAAFKPLALAADAPVGASISVISHPGGRFYTLTQGMISRYSNVMKNGQRTNRMTITADFARGSSGGPVFNEYGNVVGMVESTTSVYYNMTAGKKDNLQMVFKNCVPAENILKLIRP
jgi:hypothetical protein